MQTHALGVQSPDGARVVSARSAARIKRHADYNHVRGALDGSCFAF